MSKNIVAFGASSSKHSINKQLASWAASQLDDVEVNLLDLNDYEMPIFSMDKEEATGIPQLAHDFKEQLRNADGILISFAEHNGSFSAAFKNIFDWASRIEKSMWLDKPMFLLATSPGARGGKSVLTGAVNDFPHRGGKVVASFSLPSFMQNFSEAGIVDEELKKDIEIQLKVYSEAL
jgi:NAD(P)H-dependent FMN reductase